MVDYDERRPVSANWCLWKSWQIFRASTTITAGIELPRHVSDEGCARGRLADAGCARETWGTLLLSWRLVVLGGSPRVRQPNFQVVHRPPRSGRTRVGAKYGWIGSYLYWVWTLFYVLGRSRSDLGHKCLGPGLFEVLGLCKLEHKEIHWI